MDRVTIGLTEVVTVYGREGRKKKVKAKIDTGATRSSIDAVLAAMLQLSPLITFKLIKSASGKNLRPLMKVKVRIKGKQITSEMTIADRGEMKYPVLIGQNMLKKGFLIDPSKK